jgi:hypothetical protein
MPCLSILCASVEAHLLNDVEAEHHQLTLDVQRADGGLTDGCVKSQRIQFFAPRELSRRIPHRESQRRYTPSTAQCQLTAVSGSTRMKILPTGQGSARDGAERPIRSRLQVRLKGHYVPLHSQALHGAKRVSSICDRPRRN